MTYKDLKIKRQNNVEYWEVPTASDTSYGPHGYFRYIGKFPPQIARKLIVDYSADDDTVLDPMCGGGTVLTEAILAGRNKVIGYDINKVALTVSTAVSTVYDTQCLAEMAEKILSKFTEYISDDQSLFANKKCKSAKAADLLGNEKFFNTKALLELSSLYNIIAEIKNENVKSFFLTCFFSILRRTSLCNVKKMNIELDLDKKKIWPVLEAFNKSVQLNLALAADFPKLIKSQSRTIVVLREHDARIFDEHDEQIGLVLAHPPYMSNTAFSESTQLQLAFLGIGHKDVWKRELRNRGSYLHEPNGVRKYLVDWCKIIREATKSLKKGGHFAAVIGDGQVDTVRIPMGVITREFMADSGLEIIKQAEHILNNNTGRTLNRKMKTQHIVVGRKNGSI